MGGYPIMIRKLVLPALAATLLAGCVTDYAYRGGSRGDYYYGQPSTEYRYHGPYGGYAPYGYGGFGYGGYGVPYGYYGYPYGYGGHYHHPFYHPYYYHPYYRRAPLTSPRPGDTTPPQDRRDDRRPPWRNYDELRRRQAADGGGAAVQPREVTPARPAVEPRERDARMEQLVRRANRNAEPPSAEQEP